MNPKRANLLDKLLKGLIPLPHREEVPDVDIEYKSFSRILRKRNKSDEIGMSRDYDKSSIWFRKRRDKK